LPYKFRRLYFPCVISHVQKSNCYNVVTKPRTGGRGSDKKIGELLLPFQFHIRHQMLSVLLGSHVKVRFCLSRWRVFHRYFRLRASLPIFMLVFCISPSVSQGKRAGLIRGTIRR